MKRIKFCVFCLIIGLVLSIQTASAQTTAFTYQGSLKNGGNPANGNFDFEFALFDAVSGGTQVGSTISANSVAVSNGIFNVSLNFGSLFPGTNRFLEIRVRQTGGGAFTVLTPRQSVNSSPYSIKSLLSETTNNALSLGGIAANQYVTTTSGGANFIQNSTTQQTGNFNISGSGNASGSLSAHVVNANSHFSIGGDGVLIINETNFSTSVGKFAGGGFQNAFFGRSAGYNNTTGSNNSFFGTFVAQNNMTGSDNSFFGTVAGKLSTGNWNVFIGSRAGESNTSGSGNTTIGYKADVSSGGLGNATAIGANAVVSQSNSLVLGSGVHVGIGTSAPQQTLHVDGTSEILSTGSGSGFKFRNRGSTSSNDDWVWYAQQGIPFGTARFFKVGTGDLLTIQPTGEFAVNFLGSGGTVGLCRNASNQISTCSSSLRYKTNINPFGSGLDLISRLRPVSFNWLANNQFDFGLVAEEVAEIEPLLVSYNDKGEVEGVKYDRLGVVLINAVGEQQKQIEAQNEIIRRQQTELDSMKNFLCSQYPTAEFCQQK